MFLPRGGAAPGEAGELIYYKKLDTAPEPPPTADPCEDAGAPPAIYQHDGTYSVVFAVTPAIAWFKKHVSTDLHGVFIVPADLPSTITSSTPLFHAIQSLGVSSDAGFT